MKIYKCFVRSMFLLGLFVSTNVLAQQDGAEIFETHCAMCHSASGGNQALGPELHVLRQMTPEHILDVMDNGVMASQARERTRAQKYILAEFLSGKSFGSEPAQPIPQSAYCAADTSSFQQTISQPNWNGWGNNLENSRYQAAENAGITSENVSGLRLKWAFGYPGATSGGTQPVVMGDRLYVGNAVGDVFSLDAKSGCVHWRIEVEGGVRSAITIGSVESGGRLHAFFGDQAGNAYAVDAEKGSLIWKVKVDEHPRAVVTAAPRLYDGRLFVPVSSREESQVRNPNYPCCQFRGSMLAVDAANGEILWKTYTIQTEAKPTGKSDTGTQLWGPSGVPIWNTPTVDAKRNLLYIGTGNNYSIPATRTSDAVIAIDIGSGEIRWIKQVTANDVWNSSCRAIGENPYICPDVDAPDTDFGNSPVLATVDDKDILYAGNKLGLVYAFDPDDKGNILWTESTGKGATSGGIMWGLAVDGEKVYAANNYFDASELQSTGGVSAIDMNTGKTVWSVPALSCEGRKKCKPSHAAALSVVPGVVFALTMDGRIRALSTRDGNSLWEYDTAREFKTVNGVKANGGSMSNAGVSVVDGVLYVNSGYSHHGAIIPGNALLAFEIQ
jgi:polyvinyl alcohol dehydrogenase (cytochrome)